MNVGPCLAARAAAGCATLSYGLARPGPVEVRIYDVLGRAVERRVLAAGRSGRVDLDLGRLSAGVYLLEFDAGDQSFTTKLVVQHRSGEH